MKETIDETTAQGAPDAAKAGKAPAQAGSRPTGHGKGKKGTPKGKAKASKKAAANAKEGKSALIVAALGGKTGATMDDLITATGWAAHSVRGFISGVLRAKQGMSVERFARNDGQMAYRIAAKGGK